MKTRSGKFFSLPLIVVAIAIAATTPIYADAVVEGDLGQVLNGNFSFLFDTGPVSTDPLSWNFTCTTCSGYSLSGSGDAKVINGSLGASATVNVTGSTGPNFFQGEADSIASYTDALTITGGSGPGVLELTYTVDGVTTGTSSNEVSGGLGMGNVIPGLCVIFDSGSPNCSTAGRVAVGDGTFADTETFLIPFTYGTAFSIEPRMAANVPFFSDEDSTPFSVTVDFLNTATLDSALVFAGSPLDLGGQNNDAVIASTSGLNYGPDGITSEAPEPGTWVLVASAMAALAFLKRRKIQQS